MSAVKQLIKMKQPTKSLPRFPHFKFQISEIFLLLKILTVAVNED